MFPVCFLGTRRTKYRYDLSIYESVLQLKWLQPREIRWFSAVLWISLLHVLPFQTDLTGREEAVALLVKGSPAGGGRMLPLFLCVPCSWLMLAAFYLLVYRHSARLGFVTGSCTNIRSAAGSWEQLSGVWRHLHPPSARHSHTEPTGRESFTVRGTEAEPSEETVNMATGGSQTLISVSLSQTLLGFFKHLLADGRRWSNFQVIFFKLIYLFQKQTKLHGTSKPKMKIRF